MKNVIFVVLAGVFMTLSVEAQTFSKNSQKYIWDESQFLQNIGGPKDPPIYSLEDPSELSIEDWIPLFLVLGGLFGIYVCRKKVMVIES